MTADKVQNLWGQAFRLVSDGLAESDVVTFVEKLMSQQRESLKQAHHIDSLHKLAAVTVEEADLMASNIRKEAQRDADAESASIVAAAQEKARRILESADSAVKSQTRTAARMKRAVAGVEALKKAQSARIAEVDAALQALKESAQQELSTRMKSHYLGKHLAQSVHFLSAFEALVEEVEAELIQTEVELPPSD